MSIFHTLNIGRTVIKRSTLGAGHYLPAGGWAICVCVEGGGGHEKKIYPKWGWGQNFIYESKGGGGHKYDFHFLFWHPPPQPPPFFIHFFYRWCPLSTTHRRKEKYAYADVQTQIRLRQLMHTVAVNPQTQTNALTHRDIYGKYFNKFLIFYWTERNGMEPVLGMSMYWKAP